MSQETEPTCDFDCWTPSGKTARWLALNNATKLKTAWGWNFYEHPILGGDAPVLAIRAADGERGTVFNTQDFDLPTSDPKEPW